MLTVISHPQRRTAWGRTLLGAGLSLAALAARAQAAPPGAQFAPVVVLASREPQPLDRLVSDVVLIDADRIAQSTADSIEDLLRREAGLQVSRSGGPGQNASMFVRGAGSNNTVVLVDGVRVGSATLGLVEFENIALSAVDHIEVLRGPASSLYGADAVGGVIQIVTRRGEGAARLLAQAGFGTYGSSAAALSVGGARDGIDYAAAWGLDHSLGVSALKPGDQFGNYNPDRDGYTRENAQFQLGYTPAPGHRIALHVLGSRLRAQFDSSQYLAPDYLQDPTPNFLNRMTSAVTSVDYRGEIAPTWTTTAQLSRNRDDLDSGAELTSRYRTRRDEWVWQNAWHPSPAMQWVLAWEHLSEAAESSDYLADVRRSNQALVLVYSGQFGAQGLQADLRRDLNSVYGGTTTGRLGWNMDMGGGWRVRALAGTTYRAPSFNELYYPGYGVPSVTPEHGHSVEAGLQWRAGDGQAGLTVYNNRVNDLIGFETDATQCPTDPSYTYGCARNIGRARLRGATLSASQRWGRWELRGSADVLDARDLDTNQRLARRAAHQESLSADQRLANGSWGLALLRVGSRPDSGVNLAGYTTLDVHARWSIGAHWQLEAKLLNATDRPIEPARDYQQPGRQAWLVLHLDTAPW